MKTAVALVDFDNLEVAGIIPAKWTRYSSSSDALVLLQLLCEHLAAAAQNQSALTRELRIRLYGGWVDEISLLSRKAELVRSQIRFLPQRFGSLRLYSQLVLVSPYAPRHRLLGTVRLQSKPPRQKMVDGMMTCDAIYFSGLPDHNIILVSDDEDLVPACLAAAFRSDCGVSVCRSTSHRSGLNDRALRSQGVALVAY